MALLKRLKNLIDSKNQNEEETPAVPESSAKAGDRHPFEGKQGISEEEKRKSSPVSRRASTSCFCCFWKGIRSANRRKS